MTDRKRT